MPRWNGMGLSWTANGEAMKLYTTTGDELDANEEIRFFLWGGPEKSEEYAIAVLPYSSWRFLSWDTPWTGGSSRNRAPRYWPAPTPPLIFDRNHPRIVETKYGPRFINLSLLSQL